MERSSYRSGFTLVELAVVLAVIGVIAGGVLVGRSMIRASAVRSVAVDYTTYMGAVAQFTDQYRALPGDMANATQYWGARDADPATCIITASTDELTCDGNGDGQLGTESGSIPYERFRFWQHLKNAGLIQGRYSGVGVNADLTIPRAGVNVPASKVNKAGFSVAYNAPHLGDPNYFDEQGGNMMFFGTVGGSMWYPIISPKEAESIDLKLDDGKPATGLMTTYKSSGTVAPGCATGDTLSAEYNLQAKGPLCSLRMNIQAGV